MHQTVDQKSNSDFSDDENEWRPQAKPKEPQPDQAMSKVQNKRMRFRDLRKINAWKKEEILEELMQDTNLQSYVLKNNSKMSEGKDKVKVGKEDEESSDFDEEEYQPDEYEINRKAEKDKILDIIDKEVKKPEGPHARKKESSFSLDHEGGGWSEVQSIKVEC